MDEKSFMRWLMPLLCACIVGMGVYIFKNAVEDRYTATDARRDHTALWSAVEALKNRVSRIEKDH